MVLGAGRGAGADAGRQDGLTLVGDPHQGRRPTTAGCGWRRAPGRWCCPSMTPPPGWPWIEQACLVELDEVGRGRRRATGAARERRPIGLRMRTARLLGQRADAVVTARLAERLVAEASVVRVEVAAALGEHRSAAAREALAGVIGGEERP
ncbi:MAG: hypothetical protein R3F43_15240 [bacterium]